MSKQDGRSQSSEKTTVFISDPSVEAERITQALRAADFHVVDVPLAMLVARVAVQRPRIVILDADAEGALDAVARMRELPEAEAIDVLFCGRPGATLSNSEDALAHEASGFFARPVNVATLQKKIESLIQGGAARPESVVPAAQPSEEASFEPVPSVRSTPPSLRAPTSRPPALRPSTPSLGPAVRAPLQRVVAPGAVSSELAELLSRAEEAVADQGPLSEAPQPSPEDEIETVLPEDVLAALDAPLEDEAEDELEGPSRVTTSGGRGATTGVREPPRQDGVGLGDPAQQRSPSVLPEPVTNDGSANANQTQGEPVLTSSAGSAPRTSDGSPGSRRAPLRRTEPPLPASAPPPPFAEPSSMAFTPPRRPSSVPPPPATTVQPPAASQQSSGAPSLLSTTLGSELLVQQGGMIGAPIAPFGQPIASGGMPMPSAPSTFEEPRVPSLQGSSPRAEPPLRERAPYALGLGDAPRALAQAVAEHQTGALTFETPAPRGGASDVRRIVLRDGDVVTAASSVESESLLAFLGARGDLPRERIEALAGRLPPYGRHAGAALVAQGALGQGQLWPVLRAHAEFIMGQAMLVSPGTALLEPEPPGRLKTEPSVFGGAPGAEIFVEVIRRVISSDEAVRRAGGRASVIGEGARPQLLRECGLGAAEVDAVRTARGQRIDAVMASLPDTDIAAVLYALWLLGVVEVVPSVLVRSDRPLLAQGIAPDAIDEDAVRERIRARLQLVDEGDYFALLGVPHNATGYEVRRAYLDLRRAFEPSRLLTPALIDLAEDVRRIASVLEEAYEILGDHARRERYRRAIDDVAPPLRGGDASPSDR